MFKCYSITTCKEDGFCIDDGDGIFDMWSGDTVWRYNTFIHRLDGPAANWAGGEDFWYYYGNLIGDNFRNLMKIK